MGITKMNLKIILTLCVFKSREFSLGFSNLSRFFIGASEIPSTFRLCSRQIFLLSSVIINSSETTAKSLARAYSRAPSPTRKLRDEISEKIQGKVSSYMGRIRPNGKRPLCSSFSKVAANCIGFLTPRTAPTAPKAPLLPF